MNVAGCRRLEVGGGECQAPRVQASVQELAEARLVYRQVTGLQLRYLPDVCVHAEDVEPKTGHAGGVGHAEVSGAEHGEAESAAHEAALPRVSAAGRNAAKAGT
jgi:hypothetical protein